MTRVRYFLLAASLGGGCALAQPVSYTVDPSHTFPSFEADHMGISVWRGKLTRSSGKVVLDRAAAAGTVEIVLDPASISFGYDKLDEWARGEQFFDVAKYPTTGYRGVFKDFVQGRPRRVEGVLTLHGVTRPVDLTIELFNCIPHPLFKRELCGADASASFDREAFGLDAGKPYGFSMQVKLRIQVEAVADE